MENTAVRVSEEPEIVEEIRKTTEDRKKADDEDIQPDWGNKEEDSPTVERNCRSYCCCFVAKGCSDYDDGSLKAAGSTAVYLKQTEHGQISSAKGFSPEMKSFLNSPIYITFVIIVTFLTSILILVEVFIDAGLLHTIEESKEDAPTSVPGEETQKVSTALHWFSFALLTVFFIEILLRVIVWRLSLVEDFIAIFDCIVVFIAFLSNLCVTLAAGPQSAIDAISLVVILRLIRIHTLVKVKVGLIKQKRDALLKQADSDLHVANCKISSLYRQIKEKDYEIKQLQAYLSGQSTVDDPQLVALKTSLSDQDVKGATADADLQTAIALSKQLYDEEMSCGIVNKAFSHTKGEEIVDNFEDGQNLAVLVHERPDRLNSQGSDIEPIPKVTSYMDEYFSNAAEDHPLNEGLTGKQNHGAIRKNKNPLPPKVKVNSNDNTNNNVKEFRAFEAALKVLETDKPIQEPTTICIDASILQCDNFDERDAEIKTSNLLNYDSPVSKFPSALCEGPRPTLSSPPSDVGSSDDCILEPMPIENDTRVKTHTRHLKSWAKKSGSSLSSESGYLSEDLTQNGNGRKKLTLPTSLANDATASGDIELSTL